MVENRPEQTVKSDLFNLSGGGRLCLQNSHNSNNNGNICHTIVLLDNNDNLDGDNNTM